MLDPSTSILMDGGPRLSDGCPRGRDFQCKYLIAYFLKAMITFHLFVHHSISQTKSSHVSNLSSGGGYSLIIFNNNYTPHPGGWGV